MNQLLAQLLKIPSSNGTTNITGPLKENSPGILGRPFNSIPDIITGLLLIVFPLATGMALVYIVIASFQIMFSGGNSDKVASARGKITTAIVGVIVISLAWFLTWLVDRFFLGTSGTVV